jgi:Sigma-70 factor, region 1.1
MSVVELRELEEVKGLLAKGQHVGVLTYAEIFTATSELDLDESDVEELHGFLEKAEIELVEDIARRPRRRRTWSARPTSTVVARPRPRWTSSRT